MSAHREPLLVVEDLKKDFAIGGKGFRRKREVVRAVDGVSFDVQRGETFGLVGESGCGKSTIARCILRLTEPSSGRVLLEGTEVGSLAPAAMRRLRKQMQIVFQDPYASLDPRMSIRAIVEEPLLIHGVKDKQERRRRALDILSLVGIGPEHAARKPHEFSGGQRQRVGLARTLVLNPDLIVLDEPISALDVSIQAQVLNLLREIQDKFDLTYVFIVHDLGVAEYFCDRVAVLYLGAVMEMAEREALFHQPLHPYTVSLFSAVPIPDPDSERRRERVVLSGEVSPVGPKVQGCRFRSRCPVGKERQVCREEEPPLAEMAPGHWVSCHYPGELSAEGRALPGAEPVPERWRNGRS